MRSSRRVGLKSPLLASWESRGTRFGGDLPGQNVRELLRFEKQKIVKE